MLSVGRIYASSGQGGRVSAGWRYLWEQVAEGAEDYYSADVARGEAPGRWAGSAAGAELGLCGEVTEDQMERVFGRLMHPTEDLVLGQEPRRYRSTTDRLEAAEDAHQRRWTAEWAQREIELVAAGASPGRIDAELAGHREAAAQRWAEAEATIRRGGERAAVAAFDLTCSPPKSVSVLWAAADRPGREAIWRAHREGVTAALGYVEREAAWSRSGYNGVRQVDTSGLVVASFDHRMSRAGDVQIHTHNAVLNRVRCADGQWRTLDSRALHQVTAAAGAIYDRVREAALERDLGVRHEQRKPDGPREIVGVADEVCRLFSSRRVQIEGRLAEMVAAYTDRHGAAPSGWATAQMSRWATLETRTAKDRAETTAEALARWESETRDQLGSSLADVWDQAMAAGAQEADTISLSDDDALARAVATVDAEKATWTRYDLARQITKTVSVDASVDAAALLARVDRLVECALAGGAGTHRVVDLSAPAAFETPAVLHRSADNQSVYERHGAKRYSTDQALAAERRVLAAAARGDGPKLADTIVEGCLAAEATPLAVDQARAARHILTSGRVVDALVGPAGTGKTRTMGAIGQAWRAGGGQVLGLAVAETAARTLAAEADMATANTAKLLFEHQQRCAEDKADPAWQEQWAIGAGALVILDEAGMASRQVIDDVRQLCDTAGAKLVLVGDPEQLAGPGAGGTFALVVDQVGAATLDQVHRFAADWERRASLRVRSGDVGVLAEYDLRARIVGGDEADMETAALTAALADRARGLRTFLLADTNDQAARLAGRVRDQLIGAGQVDPGRAVALHDGNWASVGDRIVTRRNDRSNTDGHGFVANRDVWQIIELGDDGTVMAARVDPDRGQALPDHGVRLEGDYVAAHVQLEYAATVHAVQGATGAVSHAVISEHTSRDALYVALTRGVEANRAYVVCHRVEGADQLGPTRDPLGVLADIVERDDPPEHLAAVTVAERSAEQARSLATLFPQYQDLLACAGHQRWAAAVAFASGEQAAAAMVAGDAWPTLAARLRVIDAAGADSATILADAARVRSLAGAQAVASVLHWRLRHTQTTAAALLAGTFAEISPGGDDEITATIAKLAAAMDARSDELAARVDADPPLWAAALGPRPHPGDSTAERWRRRAGIIAGYREAFNLDQTTGDDADPIGPIPPDSRPDALAWWQRCAVALDRAEPAGLAQLPDEHLEAIVERARQAQRHAPPAVADQLRQVSTQLRDAHIAAGAAIIDRGPDSPAALTATDTINTLTAAAVALEAAQRRRQQWQHTTSRLQAQGLAATAELAVRTDARASAPHTDTDLATLQANLAHAEQRLADATTVAERHETRSRTWQKRADQISGQLDAGPAHLAIATRAVTAEQTAAARIDQLEAALDRGRLNRGAPRGQTRVDLAQELSRLQRANPDLPAAPAARHLRWAQHIDRARDAEQRWQAERHTHLDHALSLVRDSTGIAAPARAEVIEQAELAANLRAALERTPQIPDPEETDPVHVASAANTVSTIAPDEAAHKAAVPSLHQQHQLHQHLYPGLHEPGPTIIP